MDAFAPGSVTLVFTPLADGSGSRGVSIAIEDGVRASIADAPRTSIRLDGTRTEFEPVSVVLDALGVSAEVALSAGVPVGCGFGASGAATLASALAANAEFGLGFSRAELVEAAHRAEVEAGTGLGDVFVQDIGGIAADFGAGRERTESDERVWYSSFGAVETASVLANGDRMARVRREGTAALEDIATSDSVDLWNVLARSWVFAQRVGLATDEVIETVARVEESGGVATMAMVGETVIGIGAGSVLANETGISNEGAHVL